MTLMLPYPGSPSLNIPIRTFLVCTLLHVRAAVTFAELITASVDQVMYLPLCILTRRSSRLLGPFASGSDLVAISGGRMGVASGTTGMSVRWTGCGQVSPVLGKATSQQCICSPSLAPKPLQQPRYFQLMSRSQVQFHLTQK